MLTILHLTADYPDAVTPGTTVAVRRLIELLPEHRHIVYSLHRRNGIGRIMLRAEGDCVSSLVYRAPPYGVLLEPFLRPVTNCIHADIGRRGLSIDLVHAHKLTVDGIVADKLAALIRRPFISSVWGNTDQKIIASKPLLRETFSDIARRAHTLLPATPWIADYIVDVLGAGRGKMRELPIVCNIEPALPSPTTSDRVATMLRLDGFENKNLGRLMAAVGLLRRRRPDATLDVLGDGSPASIARVRELIRGRERFVSLRGAVPHHLVQRTLSSYAAFAMPSLRETFGMVFIEALFAGIPIVYPRGQAVDGFFDKVEIGAKCDATSIEDIAEALDRVLIRQAEMKRTIWSLHGQGWFDRFGADAIATTYRDVVLAAAHSEAIPNLARRP